MNKIIFFIKYPDPGKVKTRLAKDTGYEQAAEFYKRFVEYNLVILHKSGVSFDIWIKPENRLNNFKQWLGKNYNYKIQKDDSLGLNMKNAFEYYFENGYDKVIIIGSDCLEIKSELFENVFDRLDKTDYVIGPSFDGGYYLLGINRNSFLEKIFNIEFSDKNVLNNTIRILNNETKKYFLLNKLNDIDTLDDLKNYNLYDELCVISDVS